MTEKLRYMQNWRAETARKYAELLSKEPPFFLDPDYTIEDFAAELGTNRSYASRFVNESFGISFPTFLNKFRIAYLKRIQYDHKDTPLYKLALTCGFRNAYTFRRAFYNEYGMTPKSFFRKQDTDS